MMDNDEQLLLKEVAARIACSVLELLPIPVTVSGGGALDVVVASGLVAGRGWFIGRTGWGSYEKRGFAVGRDLSGGGEPSLTVGSYGGTALDGALGGTLDHALGGNPGVGERAAE